MSGSESRSASIAEKLDTGLEMLNDYCALAEVYVLNLQPQELAYAAAQPKQKPDKETVPKVGGRFLKTLYFAWVEIRLHRLHTAMICMLKQ